MTEIWGFIGGKLDEIDGRRSRSRSGIVGDVPGQLRDGRGRMKKADDGGGLPLEGNNKGDLLSGMKKLPKHLRFGSFGCHAITL